MADVSRAAKVGVMTVVLGAATVGLYRFVSPMTGTSSGYRVHTYLPDVTGIAPHSRVMVSGITVGVIDRLSLEKGMARVDIKMKPEFPLYIDAAVGKRSTSLIGESIIVLAPGTEGKPQIPNEGEITHFIEEPTIASLEGQIADILKDVKTVTNTLKNTVGSDRGQDQIDRILKNLAEVTEQLNGAVKENREGVKGLINNVNGITGDSRPQIAEILQNIKQVTDDVRRMTAAVDPGGGKGTPGAPGAPGAPGKPGELRSTIERINRASASLESVLGHADSIAARIDRGEGTVGRLTKDDTLINEVESTVENIGDLVGGIGRVQTVVGLRTDYNFLANTIKSYVEIRLQPAEDKYYVIELVNDPRGKTGFQQVDVDTTDPNYPPHYREIRTTTTNAFRFSFQFAKRIGPFTGRFGIKESTGGIGLDLHLLNDRFELRQDLFGFGEELSPRWRIALGYEFLRKLWLLGGVDDILNGDRRDYFVGLQLRFTDNDLKTILPFAGGLVPR
jgi:phospholipid/cholesterol/gamma-HCH transport system substrate-binding protein